MSTGMLVSRRALAVIVFVAITVGSAIGWALADVSAGDPNAPTTPVTTIQRVSPRIAVAFPVLRKPQDASEAQQLPAVAFVMSMLASQTPNGTGQANSELARRVSQAGDDAEYLVPGNEVVCMVSITAGRATGGGCAPASSVETVGTTSLTVSPGGYELTGILPRGTSDARIVDATGHTTTVVANANRAFRFFTATPLARLEYQLPGGGEHVGSLAPPPSPRAPSVPAG